MCTNTDVWLDGDFISAFASLMCHNNHSLDPIALMKSGQDVPQLTHVTYPNSHMTINDYKALPSSVADIVCMWTAYQCAQTLSTCLIWIWEAV